MIQILLGSSFCPLYQFTIRLCKHDSEILHLSVGPSSVRNNNIWENMYWISSNTSKFCTFLSDLQVFETTTYEKTSLLVRDGAYWKSSNTCLWKSEIFYLQMLSLLRQHVDRLDCKKRTLQPFPSAHMDAAWGAHSSPEQIWWESLNLIAMSGNRAEDRIQKGKTG